MSNDLKGGKEWSDAAKAKATLEGGKGVEPKGEVSGQGALWCWNCGAGNRYMNHWSFLICWNCGATNWI